ncbi:MAG: methyltransferase [Alphaproteobacteria bacterium]
MASYEAPNATDTLIWDIWMSQHQMPTVTVADELGIFASLGETPATIPELASRLGFDERATAAVLRLLTSLGLLLQAGGRYHLTATARSYLLADGFAYWGDVFKNARTYSLHLLLKEKLLKKAVPVSPDGRPNFGDSDNAADKWASGDIDLTTARNVAAFMHAHSLAAAHGAAESADFSTASKLLDVGGGSGCFSIAFAQRRPHLSCTVLELPQMCRVAEDYIARAGVSAQVNALPLDMFRQDWPRGYNAHFYSNIFHDWSFETCAWLARKTFESLPSGGAIILHEMLLNDDKAGPTTTAAFSMLMLNTQGQQFTFDQLREILEAAGFVDVTVKHSYGYYSLVSAIKP